MTLEEILDFEEGMKKILITPSIAALMLKQNVNYNRPKNERNKTKLVSQMQKGLWKEDVNSTIGFSSNNTLLDGQHRLEAIINSGCSLKMWVCNNVKEESFDVIDSGKQRTPGDIFSINGLEKGSKVAAATLLLYFLNNKKAAPNHGGRSNDSSDLTPHCLYEYYLFREEYLSKIDYSAKVFGLTDSIVFASHAYLLQFEEEEIVNDFFYKLRTGSDLSLYHPIMTFRDQIIKFANKTSKEKPTRVEYLARLLKTFQFYNKRTIKECKKIGWNEVSKEPFPYHNKQKTLIFEFNCS